MPKKFIQRNRWELLTLWIIIFTIVVGFGFRSNRQLASENRQRVNENRQLIKEQQKSRIASCKITYEAFNEVFKPFFRGKLNPTQKKNLHILQTTVKELKAGCEVQTKEK